MIFDVLMILVTVLTVLMMVLVMLAILLLAGLVVLVFVLMILGHCDSNVGDFDGAGDCGVGDCVDGPNICLCA